MTAPTLVAVAHGSRDPRAAPAVRALLGLVAAHRPGLDIRPAHLGLTPPLLPAVLAGLRGPAVLVPLLFGPGHHVTSDLPATLAAAPHLPAAIAAPLGPHPLLVRALHARLLEAGWSRRGQAVVLAAAGSRDPASRRCTERTAAMLSARLGGVPVVAGYASAAAPTVPQAAAWLRAAGLRRIAVASCFTAPGRFAARTAAAAPWIAAEPLGAHDALARLILHRYDTARPTTRRATA